MTLEGRKPGADDALLLEFAAAGAFIFGLLWLGVVSLMGWAGIGEGGFQVGRAPIAGLIVLALGALIGVLTAAWWRHRS